MEGEREIHFNWMDGKASWNRKHLSWNTKNEQDFNN